MVNYMHVCVWCVTSYVINNNVCSWLELSNTHYMHIPMLSRRKCVCHISLRSSLINYVIIIHEEFN